MFSFVVHYPSIQPQSYYQGTILPKLSKIHTCLHYPIIFKVTCNKSCINFRHCKIPGKVAIRSELGRPCPLKWNWCMPFISVVIHLMYVSIINPKWLPLCELLHILCTTAFYEISSRTCTLKLIKCHLDHNYLHHIILLPHEKCFLKLIISSSCLYNSNITDLLIFKVSISQVTRKSFRPVTSLLDQSFFIDTFGL